MSLILGYANRNSAIIMSDGRAGKNGSYSEHYNKTLKINDNIIIGFAGYVESIEYFLNGVFLNMGEERNKYYVDDFFELMQFGMDVEETQKHLHSSFIIIGRDSSNIMHTAIIGDSTLYKLESNIVTTPRILTIGGSIDGSIIHQIYRTNLKDETHSLEERLVNTIAQVSRLDNTINSNVYKVTL